MSQSGLIRGAAQRFGVALSKQLVRSRGLEESGSVAPGQMDGHKPKAVSGDHAVWLSQRIKDGVFSPYADSLPNSLDVV